MRDRPRDSGGRLLELPPYFARMEREGIACGWCGEGRVTLRPTLSERVAMGECDACGKPQAYSCPPGMAYVSYPGDPPPGRRPMGKVIEFRPRA